jgi:hypothetical protein
MPLQQAGGDRHQGRVLERAGGKGIRLALIDADFGHADAGLVGKLAHGVDDPSASSWVGGLVLMICTPVLHLAMGLLISSEMMAPPKPMMKAKPSSEAKFRPLAVKKRLTPSKLASDAQHQQPRQGW